MISYLWRYTFPAAFDLLPPGLAATESDAMLLAIALQESGGIRRRQSGNGPARGFWQFETGGIVAVLRHPETGPLLRSALVALCYPSSTTAINISVAIEHNDVLACVLARLLLWTVPGRLPGREMADIGWMQYLQAWRPGAPRPKDWPANFSRAWNAAAAGLDT